MFEYLFSQYRNYPKIDIILEIIGAIFGLWSVWLAKKDNILVFPTGLVSTFIYAYLLWQWELLGDSMINVYYFVMSIYGWYHWTRKKGNQDEFPIAVMNNKEKRIAFVLFTGTIIFVIIVYFYFNKFTNWYSYVDTFLTGLFFVGMWLMAKRKIENWIFWIIGDVISIPLYFAKGFTFTSLQFLIFTIVAIYGYLEWKKILNNSTIQEAQKF
ncbi:nicotinamide mononucleotide transporter [Flavobacterium franklandianum]|uniref:Nicotinamide riboside transporter PnuC n=1 Tax=Flavobacterium franklandianum TaxID=2594430 RepID=A0A553CU73_9FLAO|nr:nicotinamide riboside transporter PnuC [Flavobacterium franklandianum]TRX24011.1 nicotinamide mononucleotide transporter [Flavobacterium franklandianum]TRX25346.1 nicotinamide mononucleotide transporter [Flavobacterium franklandianum]